MKIRNIITELKNSKWPSKKEVAVLTIYTLVLCGIITLIMLGLDLLLYFVRDWFLAL